LRKVTCAGILVADLIAADLPRVSGPGEITFTRRAIETHIGGHAANVSADLMRLGMKPGEVGCLGAVGNDPFADFFEKTLASHRVSVSLQRTAAARTSVDLILVVKGEDRRYHVDVGANSDFDPAFVLRSVRREKPLLFYAGGTGLMARFDRSLAAVLREVKGLGCVTFVDPVMPVNNSWGHLQKALKWTDIFHCNDGEARSLTGQPELGAAIRDLLNSGPQLLLLSRGAGGVIAATGRRRLSLEAFRVKTLDPTGAGDAFCAGFIRKTVQHLRGAPAQGLDWTDEELAGMLLEAEAAGAACVTGVGTTSAVKRETVDALLAAQMARVKRTLKVEATDSPA
jgi:fructokinase